MSEMTPERRKVIVLCACVACMGGGPILLKNHAALILLWLGAMVAVLAYAMVLLFRLKEFRR